MEKSLTKTIAGAFFLLCALHPVDVSAAKICGSVISIGSGQGVGMYSFDTSGVSSFEPISGGEGILAQGGGVYVDGRYYSINVDDMTLTAYDSFSWDVIKAIPASHAALDLTYDTTDGKIYGCYSDSGFPKLGTLDVATGTFSEIGSMRMPANVLVSDGTGTLYAIAMDGGIYTVDKQTAAMTQTGSTGLWPFSVQSATVDPTDGKCYWAAIVDDGISWDYTYALYEVDLSSGAATKLYDFPNTPEITGLYIAPEESTEAPAQPESFKAVFDKDATSGKLTFSMPTQSVGGSALTGTLDWKLSVDGEEFSTGKAAAGSEVSVDVTLDRGEHSFEVVAISAGGESRKASFKCWVGLDDITPVSDLTLKKTSPTGLTLSWKGNAKGVHGGYVDLSTLSYEVVRYPGNVTVSSGKSDEAFSEEVEAPRLAPYWYVVTARAGESRSEEVSSNKVTMGEAKAIPYEEGFESTVQYANFMVYDRNEDGLTWSHDLGSESASYDGQYGYNADDWLVSPQLALDKDTNYTLEFDVLNRSFDRHLIEVKIGQLPGVEEMDWELLPETELNVPYENQHVKVNFHVAASGDHYLGFHLVSQSVSGGLALDNIKVTSAGSVSAPAAPVGLAPEAFANGGLGVTLKGSAPKFDIKGDALTGTLSVAIARDGKNVDVIENVAPGADINYVDKNAHEGFNLYTLVASNNFGAGEVSEVKVYVGNDIPGLVSDIDLNESETGKVTISWNAPSSGANNGSVDPKTLRYKVLRNGWKEIAVDTDLTSVVDCIDESLTTQMMVFYQIIATSDAGEGEPAMSGTIVAGTPYSFPFAESFANGRAASTPWYVETDDDLSGWTPMLDSDCPSVDADGGIMGTSCYTTTPAEMTLYSPKLSVEGMVNPVLQFHMFNRAISDVMDLVVIAGGNDRKKILSFPLMEESAEWNRVVVPLNEFVDYGYIQLAFVTTNICNGDKVYIDAISLVDDLDHNLSATHCSVPVKVRAGIESMATVSVENRGYADASSYTVRLYSGSTLISEVDGPAVEAGATKHVDLPFVASSLMKDGMELHGEVNYSKDQNRTDDASASVIVSVESSAHAAPTALEGKTDNGTVVLSWQAPVAADEYEVTIETFEDYQPFSVDAANGWSYIEGNPDYDSSMEFQDSHGVFIEFPGDDAWVNYAYTVVDLSQMPNAERSQGWSATSGNRFIMSAYNACYFGTGCEYVGDYLVSPELYGGAQTISFYAKSLNFQDYGLETVKVMASATGRALADFKEVASFESVSTEWTSYQAALPEGTKYFAIFSYRTTTALFIDDISYIAAGAKTEALAPVGYNIYRDGMRLNAEVMDVTTYLDADVDVKVPHDYVVTAMYADGESEGSAPFRFGSTGLDLNQSSGISILAGQGYIIVNGADGEPVAIYGVDGHKLMTNEARSGSRISLQSGIYLVNVAGSTYKVAVR